MEHPQIISAALFERDGRVLAVHRKPARKPLANQWLLPLTTVSSAETAEDAVRRHAREQFGLEVAREAFADTVYIDDPDDRQQYVANIFRTEFAAGALRFRTDGDYDDARWLEPGELALVWMPPTLRDSAVRLLNEPADPSDVARSEASSAVGAVPLAERSESPPPVEEPPDNRAGWDAISKAYQDEIFGERFAGKLMWSWTLSEDDLHLLDDVRGKQVIVLGCGGGQDVIALCEMGATAVGIDQSEKQIAYARKLAVKREAANSSFVCGTVEDLSRFEDQSFDAAISAHMLNYVERIEDTLQEVARVLRPRGVFALSVRHPFDAIVSEQAPYRLERSYWDIESDWTWSFESGASGRFRQWFWPISQWIEMLERAGFEVERICEPKEISVEGQQNVPNRPRLIPDTLAFKARKP
jgi:SAM-dependent methyltransferase/8-oxo-dGTP pyrophosphatase MutT (NUDIX family)